MIVQEFDNNIPPEVVEKVLTENKEIEQVEKEAIRDMRKQQGHTRLDEFDYKLDKFR